MSRPQNLFASGRLSDALAHHEQEMRDALATMPKAELLAASEADLIADLYERFKVDAPVLLMNERTISQSDTQVDVSGVWSRDVRDRSRPALIPGVRVRLRVPFTGDPQVFKLQASRFKLLHAQAEIAGGAVIVTTEFPRDSEPERDVLRQRLEGQIAQVEERLGFARADLQQFNGNLEGAIGAAVTRRREQLIADERRLAAFDLPVDGPAKPPQTYAAPSPPRRRERARAERSRAHPPEPALAQRDYEDLLDIIRHTARQMERTPKVYAGGDEETRRHHLLVAINSHFPGSSYAEAFNGRGKTDIIKRTGKTDGALRTVALPDVALGILAAMPRPLAGSELVFKAPKGGPINLRNFRRRAWYKALADAGVERRPPYQCRHTFATLALAAGADVYWVSRQLGHTDIGTTLKHYTRFVPDVQERNLGLLNDYFRVELAAVGEGGQAFPAPESERRVNEMGC